MTDRRHAREGGVEGFELPANDARRPARHRGPRRRSRDRGATLVEFSLTLSLFLTIVMGVLDIGLAVFRYHQLTDAARYLSRKAAVHGSQASTLGVWGASTLQGSNGPSTPVGLLLSQRMVGVPTGTVQYTMFWPDGGNVAYHNDRVGVGLQMSYTPLLTSLVGIGPFTMSTSSIVPIAH
jgi:Flp pilus assembly protein TadG